MNPTYNELLKDLERYIEENWTRPEEPIPVLETEEEPGSADSSSEEVTKGGKEADGTSPVSLESLLLQVGDTFHEMLFQISAP